LGDKTSGNDTVKVELRATIASSDRIQTHGWKILLQQQQASPRIVSLTGDKYIDKTAAAAAARSTCREKKKV
jgi:hypothetical protein